MKKKVLEAIRTNHPKATGILMCTYKFGKRYYAIDENFNRTDITEEFTSICRMLALDELVRRINEGELV
jgi:hypothetical protein